MYIINKPKVVFVDIPKTGTRSVLKALQHNFPDGKTMKDHVMAVPANFRKSHKTFTVVRDPYERVISLWWSTCKRDNDNYDFIDGMRRVKQRNTLEGFLMFIKIVRDGKFNAAYRLKGHRLNFLVTQAEFFDKTAFTHVLKNESLDDDFQKLPFIEGRDIHLPHINTTTKIAGNNPTVRPPSEELLTPRAIHLINTIYERDFKLLDYTKR